ncbi:MAG: alkaline phosphatase family protein [Promethearchaeota archaeon]|jgi:predicted AlkP superfamily phosphohydrolase/phosphomutase
MRVFLLGLDGMTLKIIEPYVEANLLPNFKKLMDMGSWGTLQSTIPPITGPGWVSLTTGKNAGKHGIFEFRKRTGYKTELLTKNTSAKAEPLWKTLSRHEKRVVLINIPFTYPPDEVNGILISGMTAPSAKKDFVYPRQAKDNLLKIIPDYQIDAGGRESILSGDKKTLVKQLFKITKDRRKLMRHYLDCEPWDLFFITFVATDRIQHFMWDEIISKESECVSFYQLLDDILGEVMEQLDKETALLVVSDHGFCASRKSFCVNTFLSQSGLLKVKEKSKASSAIGNVDLTKITATVYMFAKRIGLLRLKDYLPLSLLKLAKERLLSGGLTENKIDWDNTKAFSLLWYAVDINLKGRESRGVVPEKNYEKLCEKVTRELLNIRDPETGNHIIRKIYRGRDLYTTDYGHNVPDLVIDMNNGYGIRNDLRQNIIDNTKVGNIYITGTHDLDGIFMAYGDVINRVKTNAEIFDIYPTILYLMGLPIPEDVDGRVLTEIINKDYTVKHENKIEKNKTREISGESMSAEDTEEVEKRLRDLGYLR